MRGIFAFSPTCLAIALWGLLIPLWNVGASLAMGLLCIVFLINTIKTKSFPHLKNPRSLAFLFFLISILISTLFHFDSPSLNELKTILPFCLAPLLFSNQIFLEKKEITFIWSAIIVGASISLLASICYGIFNHPLPDPRKASFLISHIRLSLLASVLFFHTLTTRTFNRWVSFSIFFLSVSFLYITATISGLAFFLIGTIIYLAHLKKLRLFLIITPLSLGAIAFFFSSSYFPSPVSSCHQSHSLNGEVYNENYSPLYSENGYLTYSCIAPKELVRSWGLRTGRTLDEKDERGQPLKETLIRYLTSRGLTKDEVGLSTLTDEDLNNIKKGYTNCNESSWGAVEKRAHQIHFEYCNFLSGGKSAGHSVFQRLYLYNITKDVLIKIPWGGIGVSNSKLLFENEYARLELDKQHMPNQPHNQFLTLWLNHGVFAFLFFLLALIILFLRIKTTPYKVGATCFLGLFLASCLTEDTLNSQPGVGIATVFVLLYFFILPNEQKASLAEENSPPPKL